MERPLLFVIISVSDLRIFCFVVLADVSNLTNQIMQKTKPNINNDIPIVPVILSNDSNHSNDFKSKYDSLKYDSLNIFILSSMLVCNINVPIRK